MPIEAIVERAYGAADLDAIRVRLDKEIAAADYPYPIGQDLDELVARGAELRDDLVWARGRIIADDPESVARGEDSDDVVEFIRWRVAQLKEELLIESPYFVLPAGAQATVKALHERNVRVRVLTNSLASNDVLPAHSGYAKTRKQLLERGMELYELRPDTDVFRPGWSLLSKGSRWPCTPRPWPSIAKPCSSAASTSTRAPPGSTPRPASTSRARSSRKGWCGLNMATGVVPANSYRVRLDRNGEVVWETVTDGRNGALPGRARHRLPAGASSPTF